MSRKMTRDQEKAMFARMNEGCAPKRNRSTKNRTKSTSRDIKTSEIKTSRYWEGDPERHSEAAILGWANRKGNAIIGNDKHWYHKTETMWPNSPKHKDYISGIVFKYSHQVEYPDIAMDPKISGGKTRPFDIQTIYEFYFAKEREIKDNKKGYTLRAYKHDIKKDGTWVESPKEIKKYYGRVFAETKNVYDFMKKEKNAIETSAIVGGM